ncbi:hypothetical protein E2C01_081546 [Portunus trituberculatus]|uniref:Uncharacterized protein n=1 Tax=Portunus trituberculatus TaxID=210409 RepID=A0A5B7IQ21_PORTR|nr:hypothetical protein [Portunus trituberculatus]
MVHYSAHSLAPFLRRRVAVSSSKVYHPRGGRREDSRRRRRRRRRSYEYQRLHRSDIKAHHCHKVYRPERERQSWEEKFLRHPRVAAKEVRGVSYQGREGEKG